MQSKSEAKGWYGHLHRLRRSCIDKTCHLKYKVSAMNHTHDRSIVIIGGMAAGMRAALAARRSGCRSVTVIEASSRVAYCLCNLPYYIAGELGERELFQTSAKEIEQEYGITILLGHRVTECRRRTVIGVRGADGNAFSIPYDTLVLATGAEPDTPGIAGLSCVPFYSIRGLGEAGTLRKSLAASPGSTVAIIGGGYIGCELSAALRRAGHPVYLLEREPQILPGFNDTVASLVAEELRQNDVGIQCGTPVREARLAGTSVELLTDNRDVRADYLVIVTGVRPRTKLAEQLELRRAGSGAVWVDERQQTSVRNVYAAGDCAVNRNAITGTVSYFPSGVSAIRQGRCAGLNAAGRFARYGGTMRSQVLRIFDLEVGKIGFPGREAEKHVGSSVSALVETAGYPGVCEDVAGVAVELTVETAGGRLLGMQVAGRAAVAKKVDVIAAAIASGMRLDSFLDLELGYAPHIAPALDPLMEVAYRLKNNLTKILDSKTRDAL